MSVQALAQNSTSDLLKTAHVTCSKQHTRGGSAQRRGRGRHHQPPPESDAASCHRSVCTHDSSALSLQISLVQVLLGCQCHWHVCRVTNIER
eukprot:256066-Rhodomonas_salina.3